MSRTRSVVLGGSLVVLLAALYLAERGSQRDAPTLEQMADDIGADVMLHLYRGHVAGRSGDIMLVPKPHRYLTGRWDLRTLGSDNPETFVSHPNPWAYLARVPLIFHGPGYLDSGREISIPADLTDVAPTYARLLGLEGFAADGIALGDVLETDGPPPRVIATVVLDGGGWNVLRRWPDAWPNIARLSERGVTYTNATIGSAPSLTAAIHSNLGTGHYPIAHGVPTNPWLPLDDPSTLQKPTISELWDEHTSNRAVVGMIGYEAFHLGMIGRGAQRAGGDRDLAVLWDLDRDEWETNEKYYELPDYLTPTDLVALRSYEQALDRDDGAADGSWRGDDFERIREATPAFARFTGDAAVDMITNESIGRDAIADLFWVEMKMPDSAGHMWNMESPEEEAVLREVDRQVGRFHAAIERVAGRDGYVFAITADHGQEPFAEVTGGWRINLKELQADVEAEFGPIVELVTTLDIHLKHGEVEQRDVDITDVVDFVATYTLGDNIPADAPGAEDAVPERRDELLFAGAFPTGFLQELTATEIRSFGDSVYREGELRQPP